MPHQQFLNALCPLLLVLLASCASPAGEPDIRAGADGAIPANVSFDQVLALPTRPADRRIVYGGDPLQYGLLWQADDPATAPTIVFIHGGCWLNAYDIRHSIAATGALADAGYNVWSLEYRRTGDPGGGWPGTFLDIQQGINHLAELGSHEINSRDLILMGHSAGGHLALLAGSQTELLTVPVSRVIALAGITDVIDYARGNNDCQTAAEPFMGSSLPDNPEAWSAANPSSHGLHQKSVLLHGSADTVVPLTQTERVEAEVIVSNGAGHFDWVHPGTPAFTLLLQILGESDD